MTDERYRLKIKTNMKIADAIAELSTCNFTKVGAVIVDTSSNRIIATGYNGSYPGAKHCTEMQWEDSAEGRQQHKEWSDNNEIHAELNAILNAAKNGAKIESCHLYTTVSPCRNCLKHIKTAGISKVYYTEQYWRYTDEEMNSLSNQYNISLEKV